MLADYEIETFSFDLSQIVEITERERIRLGYESIYALDVYEIEEAIEREQRRREYEKAEEFRRAHPFVAVKVRFYFWLALWWASDGRALVFGPFNRFMASWLMAWGWKWRFRRMWWSVDRVIHPERYFRDFAETNRALLNMGEELAALMRRKEN